MALPTAEERFATLKNLLVCFGLSNLYFISAWYRIQNLQAPFANYYRASVPDLTILKATLLDVMLVAAAFALAYLLGRRLGKVGDCLFLGSVAFAIDMARLGWPDNSMTEHLRNWGAIAAEAAILSGLVLRLTRNNRVLVTASQRGLLLFNFLFLALAVHFVSSWIATPGAAEFANARPAQASQKEGPRVLWLLFDAMDQRLSFDARPAELALPELDRFRAESLSAAQAFPPARYTSYSVPALLTGRLFEAASPEAPDVLRLIPRGGGQPVTWTSLGSIFFDVRKMGLDTRVTGWYHPYCREFGRDLVECTSEQSVVGRDTQEAYAESLGLAGAMKFVLLQRWEEILIGLRIERFRASDELPRLYAQKQQQTQYLAIRQRSIDTMRRFRSGLYYIHWPIPHLPGQYDRRRSGFDITPESSYLDNLALVDRTLGELRAAMRREGTWDSTTVLITSDHGYRWEEGGPGTPGFTQEMNDAVGAAKSLTVPVLIRFAGHREALSYSQAFNSVLLHDLVLGVLRGQLTTGAQAAHWLDSNHSRFPISPPQPIP